MTFNELADLYLSDQDSPFHSKRYVTREGYMRLIGRLRTEMGDVDLTTLKMRDLKQRHEAWKASGVAMAHGLTTMFRIVVGFGAIILEDEVCQRIKGLLGSMRFENARKRMTSIEAEQATDVRDYATFHLYYAVALAQAFQFDCAFRQKDVIGEWIPVGEPEPSTILSRDGTMKWVRGITREEVDADLVLTHETSKRGKVLVFPLTECPMVMEEWFSAPPSGPLIVDPETRLPYEGWKYRRIWRRMAGMAGVPKTVWNMDSRAGRITQVLAAGASLEDARKLAGHEQSTTTTRYSRGNEAAIVRALAAAKKKPE